MPSQCTDVNGESRETFAGHDSERPHPLRPFRRSIQRRLSDFVSSGLIRHKQKKHKSSLPAFQRSQSHRVAEIEPSVAKDDTRDEEHAQSELHHALQELENELKETRTDLDRASFDCDCDSQESEAPALAEGVIAWNRSYGLPSSVGAIPSFPSLEETSPATPSSVFSDLELSPLDSAQSKSTDAPRPSSAYPQLFVLNKAGNLEDLYGPLSPYQDEKHSIVGSESSEHASCEGSHHQSQPPSNSPSNSNWTHEQTRVDQSPPLSPSTNRTTLSSPSADSLASRPTSPSSAPNHIDAPNDDSSSPTPSSLQTYLAHLQPAPTPRNLRAPCLQCIQLHLPCNRAFPQCSRCLSRQERSAHHAPNPPTDPNQNAPCLAQRLESPFRAPRQVQGLWPTDELRACMIQSASHLCDLDDEGANTPVLARTANTAHARVYSQDNFVRGDKWAPPADGPCRTEAGGRVYANLLGRKWVWNGAQGDVAWLGGDEDEERWKAKCEAWMAGVASVRMEREKEGWVAPRRERGTTSGAAWARVLESVAQ